jgi:hypothetical protein
MLFTGKESMVKIQKQDMPHLAAMEADEDYHFDINPGRNRGSASIHISRPPEPWHDKTSSVNHTRQDHVEHVRPVYGWPMKHPSANVSPKASRAEQKDKEGRVNSASNTRITERELIRKEVKGRQEDKERVWEGMASGGKLPRSTSTYTYYESDGDELESQADDEHTKESDDEVPWEQSISAPSEQVDNPSMALIPLPKAAPNSPQGNVPGQSNHVSRGNIHASSASRSRFPEQEPNYSPSEDEETRQQHYNRNSPRSRPRGALPLPDKSSTPWNQRPHRIRRSSRRVGLEFDDDLSYPNMPATRWTTPPDDTATWLYRLVFMDEAPPPRGISSEPLTSEEAPKVVQKLLLEWTSADPEALKASEVDEGYQSQTKEDVDEKWEEDVQHLIEDLKHEQIHSRETIYDSDDSFVPRQSRFNTHTGYNPYGPERPGSPLRPSTFPQPPLYNDYYGGSAANVAQTLNRTIEYLQRALEASEKRYDLLQASQKALENKCRAYKAEREAVQHEYQQKLHDTQLSLIPVVEQNKCQETKQRLTMEAEQEAMRAAMTKKYEEQVRIGEKIRQELELRVAELRALELRRMELRKREEEEKLLKEKEAEQSAMLRQVIQVSSSAGDSSLWDDSQVKEKGLTLEIPSASRSLDLASAIRGSALWRSPALVNSSEMFAVLLAKQWKPLWMRGSSKCRGTAYGPSGNSSTERGETWFLGDSAILMNFFNPEYATHSARKSGSPTRVHGGPVWWKPREDEYAAIGIGLVDREAINMLDLPYKGEYDGQHRFEVTVTHVSY